MYNIRVDKKEFFAAKLAAGTATTASKMAAWWPRHAHAGMEYLGLIAGGCRDDHKVDGQSSMVKVAQEWESKVPPAVRGRAGISIGLMAEHALLECVVADAALSGDAALLDRTTEKLFSNINAHAPRYAHAIRGFPEDRFSALLLEHTSIFIDAVMARIERDTAAISSCTKLMERNAVSLATITAEWF